MGHERKWIGSETRKRHFTAPGNRDEGEEDISKAGNRERTAIRSSYGPQCPKYSRAANCFHLQLCAVFPRRSHNTKLSHLFSSLSPPLIIGTWEPCLFRCPLFWEQCSERNEQLSKDIWTMSEWVSERSLYQVQFPTSQKKVKHRDVKFIQLISGKSGPQNQNPWFQFPHCLKPKEIWKSHPLGPIVWQDSEGIGMMVLLSLAWI